MLQGDQDFKLHDEIKKIIIGVIFLVGMPLLIGTYANVDILQGCVTYSAEEVKRLGATERLDADGNVLKAAVEGTCKIDTSGDDPLKGLLASTQYYISIGITLVILALGFAILIGPGIKLIRH